MPSICDLLNRNHEMQPIPTDMAVRVSRAALKPKALIFDIYGTLLQSASGDIDKAELSPEKLLQLLPEAGLPFPSETEFYVRLCELYRELIVNAGNKLKNSGCEYPEIDILEIWKALLRQLVDQGLLSDMPDNDALRDIAMRFEIVTNPSSPMPGMEDLIPCLRDAGLQLGIISNAQFYTPIILRFFLTDYWDDKSNLREWFNPLLSFFSYREKRAKPDPVLFREMRENLEASGITPEAVLFVGNDVKKDLLPAAAEGFGTVLFAGDARSLRRYENLPEAAAFQPDHVISELAQLKDICGL